MSALKPSKREKKIDSLNVALIKPSFIVRLSEQSLLTAGNKLLYHSIKKRLKYKTEYI